MTPGVSVGKKAMAYRAKVKEPPTTEGCVGPQDVTLHLSCVLQQDMSDSDEDKSESTDSDEDDETSGSSDSEDEDEVRHDLCEDSCFTLKPLPVSSPQNDEDDEDQTSSEESSDLDSD